MYSNSTVRGSTLHYLLNHVKEKEYSPIFGIPNIHNDVCKYIKEKNQPTPRRLFKYVAEEQLVESIEMIYYDYNNETYVNILPRPLREQLIKAIETEVERARQNKLKKGAFDADGNPKQFLQDGQIRNIRTKFYETNAKLFMNYFEHIKEDNNQISLDCV